MRESAQSAGQQADLRVRCSGAADGSGEAGPLPQPAPRPTGPDRRPLRSAGALLQQEQTIPGTHSIPLVRC